MSIFSSNFFNAPAEKIPQLDEFIKSTENPKDWTYDKILNLATTQVYESTYDMIMDNPDDVINGVNRVQVISQCVYFNLFSSLIIKHSGDGSIMLVFNEIVTDANRVLIFLIVCGFY